MPVALSDRFLGARGFSRRKQRVLHAARILLILKATHAGDHARSSIPFLRVLALGVTTAVGLMGMRPRRIEAPRIAMPGNACAVSLCKWLCPFWRALTRRIGPMPRRSKQVSILELIPCNGGPTQGEWRGPAYSEASLQTLDHNDSRPELLRWRRITETGSLDTAGSTKERPIRRACLPYAPRLERILLKNGYSLRLNFRDFRDFFYLFQVDDKRLKDRSWSVGCPKAVSVILKTSPETSCRRAASNTFSAVT